MNRTADIVAAALERSGGCLCGRIRLAVPGRAPSHPAVARTAKKLGGGPMMWWAGFAPQDVTWTGESEPTWSITFEGEAQRGFLPLLRQAVSRQIRDE